MQKNSSLHQLFKIAGLSLVLVGVVATSFFTREELSFSSDASQDNKSLMSQAKFDQQLTSKPSVLGTNKTNYQRIYISGGTYDYSSGGLIAIASTDQPSVTLDTYNISGVADVEVYQADEAAVLDYLTHDKDGKQTKKIDLSRLQQVKSFKHNVADSLMTLPIGESGIWVVKLQLGSVTSYSIIVRSKIGSVVKEGDNEYVFWTQSFVDKRSLKDGNVRVYNLQDLPQEVANIAINNEGIATAPITAEGDVAIVQQGQEWAIIPLNLHYLNTGYNYDSFVPKKLKAKYFIFTDRPLYRPGDKVYFKGILRDDDDARYSIPGGSAKVKIYDGWDEKDVVYERTVPISKSGSVDGEYSLEEDAKTGGYSVKVEILGVDPDWYGTSYFSVEHFRKPEYSIDASASQTELIQGETASFKIKGDYFFGQPLAGQDIKYRISSGDFYEYYYGEDTDAPDSDFRYFFPGGSTVAENSVTLDKKGEAEVNLETKFAENVTKSQVYSIEAEIDDGSGNPSFARKNILVYAGDFSIFRSDDSYGGGKVGQSYQLPLILKTHKGGNVSGIKLSSKVRLTRWVKYDDPNTKYDDYKKEEEDLPGVQGTSDNQGKAALSFVPKKSGSYTITVEGKDKKGNVISNEFYAWVSEKGEPVYSSENSSGLSIQPNKSKYDPTDSASLTVSSEIANRDILLTFERGRTDRYFVVSLDGKESKVDVPLQGTDMPNIYASVSSFSQHSLDYSTVNLPVSPLGKKIVVKLTPDKEKYGPGEKVAVNIETTDVKGNPVSAETGVWAVDKALFELVENNTGKIFKTFWDERYNDTQSSHSLEGITVQTAEMGGCFAAGTKVLLAGGKEKNIEDIKPGELILTRLNDKSSRLVQAVVKSVHAQDAAGYLIINGDLKVTLNHILWVNGSWQEAGNIQNGDLLLDKSGNYKEVTSVEWQAGKFKVYNLEVEKHRTFFANGYWVHNQKGDGARSVFKDTAYWNPTVRTDENGRAQVNFQLPDNLTTWVIAGVSATADTKVGQGTSELVVGKDVVIRPILPNILRTEDKVVLSAIIQNFTNNDHVFDIDLSFDSGTVKEVTHSGIAVAAGDFKQLYWDVLPTKENEKAKLTFAAKSRTDDKARDAAVQEIQVQKFGFFEKTAEVGDGAKSYNINLSKDSDLEKSSVMLSLSPTLLGTLPQAMKYLVEYPFGCVEQTTSRFVPAVIAKQNLDIFGASIADKDLDDILKEGVARLKNQQSSDGGWGWWHNQSSDPFITSYVVEYLLAAKSAGVEVEQNILDKAKSFLEGGKYYLDDGQQAEWGKDANIFRIYGLSLLESPKGKELISDFSDLTPDVLSYAVLANVRNGNVNPNTNGLQKLILLGKSQGEGLFWEGGSLSYFGSSDASTALALRAIIAAEGDRDIAVKAARFLTRNRKSEYWSNTFATAQVVQSIVDFAKIGDELSPSYSYRVNLDGKEIKSGVVSSSDKIIKDVAIPVKGLKANSRLEITKDGEGELYSTLVVKAFHTDKDIKPQSNGLSLKREYINDKGRDYSLGVGDLVTVELTVSGLSQQNNYGVIADELPSGMIPVNTAFLNQQYGQTDDDYYRAGREYTQNGAVLSLYRVYPEETVYTYKARVVAAGEFLTPPAIVALMYSPEVNGRMGSQVVKTVRDSGDLPGANVKRFLDNPLVVVGAAGVLILAGFGVYFYIVRKRLASKDSVSHHGNDSAKE